MLSPDLLLAQLLQHYLFVCQPPFLAIVFTSGIRLCSRIIPGSVIFFTHVHSREDPVGRTVVV